MIEFEKVCKTYTPRKGVAVKAHVSGKNSHNDRVERKRKKR